MKQCPKCKEWENEDSATCRHCHADIQLAWTNPALWKSREDEKGAGQDEFLVRAATILVTTTPTVQNRTIGEYHGVVSAVAVLGTSIFSELSAGIADLFGARSGAFQGKLCQAREAALKELKIQAVQRGADAVIGVDLDYMTLANNMLMVSANGTAVTFLE